MKINQNIRCVYRPDRLLLYFPSGKLFEINEIGKIIFDMIKKGLDEKQIIEEIHNKTNEKIRVIEKDVKEIVEEMKKNDIIK